MALPMMKQTELIEELADRTGFPKGEVKHVLSSLEDVVHEVISDCERIKVAGVTIEPKLRAKRKSRMGRNPRTGEDVKIAAKPASVKVTARVTKPLQEAAPSVNKLQNAL